ncbi:NAD(P)H-dependent oxidoreductase [Catenulispora subtropica]|uniref:NAD(P)H-dependent oxidoreductase n=1 Tax=Catenulispora subtropica TaxID=450798 RepID=A0ABN2S0X3_9ACTN
MTGTADLSAHPLRVAVIIGSTRDGRFGPRVASWFTEQAADSHPDLDLDVIDLAEADLPLTMSGFGRPRPAAVEDLAPRLAGADAFVVVTPEYNHSFPAALKNAVDWYSAEWRNKPVAFVSYGGLSGGLRAVQHLRQVFIELQAVPIRDSVSFHEYWGQFAEDGSWPRPAEARDRAVRSLLDQLTWMGATLRGGRTTLAASAVRA